MLYLKTLLMSLPLVLLSACGEDDAENFVGRWADPRKALVLQISDIGGGNVQIETTALDFNRRLETFMVAGEVDGNVMEYGNMGSKYIYDAESDTLRRDDVVLRRAPADWNWGDDKALLGS
ncbi:hypothetical protein BCF46_1075 [Litoreibacter meonggei]|uniref:Lipoprotein n=1 Tax=Litoreibacter meonggei TaxID=1049199 RepID=A0A497WTC6_9RHOB|nr:hypothetical protein [Litoreibacter meonggei]RLJ58937.1 hypothetical protein BCF46_1075 [Litoreibacter meonggei]